MKATRRGRRGFTLIEVILVIAIIVILAGVLIFAIGGTEERAKKDACGLLVRQVCDALDKYKLHVGEYPTEQDGGLQALRTQPEYAEEGKADKWAGPYLKADPVDPWGQQLSYQLTDPGTEEARTVPYKVWSFGPNKQDDNGAEDDIRNRSWEDAEKQT
jgi:general secretion pathway protein G